MSDELSEDIHRMGRIAAGDRTAFAELFDRHSPVVLGVLVKILGRRAEAEEVLQETFLQAWRQAGRYRPERSGPRGWLLVLARSRALDRLRSRDARRQREERTVFDLPNPGRAEPVGTDRLEAGERRRRMSSALAELPEEQRRCIELSYFEGLSHSQIADRLAAPLGTVKSRMLLGMRKLKTSLAGGAGGPRR